MGNKRGRPSKYGEPTELTRIPVSKLTAVLEFIESDRDPDATAEYYLLLKFIDWLRSEKEIQLCEWHDGTDEDGIKIPRGFIPYKGHLLSDYENYKGESIFVQNKNQPQESSRVDEDPEKNSIARQMADKLIASFDAEGLNQRQRSQILCGLMFRVFQDELDKSFEIADIMPHLALMVDKYMTKGRDIEIPFNVEIQ